MGRVLVACEFSGTVRDAFIRYGHDAISCDLLPSESPGPHIHGDIMDVDLTQFDLMIAHPPCTYLAVSGARWAHGDTEKAERRRALRAESIEFVRYLMSAPVPMIAVENPVGAISRFIRKPDQYVQPYEFGHTLQKKTGLWLKNLPLLTPTAIVEPEYVISGTGRRWSKWFWDTSQLPISTRGHERSKTFQGIADAMAEQWGKLL